MADQPAPAPAPAAQPVTDPAPPGTVVPPSVQSKAAAANKKLIADLYHKEAKPDAVGDGPEKKPEAAAKPVEGAKPAAEVKPTDSPAKPASILDLKKPEPAVAAAPAPADDIPEPPADAPAATKTNWAKLRAKADKLQQERDAKAREYDELKKQLDSQRAASPADQAELQRLKDERQALSDRLAIVDLQSHPDFHRQYVEPRTKALTEADTILKDNGTEGVELGSLLARPRAEFAKTVSELAAKLPTFDAGSFVQLMRQAYQTKAEEMAALGKASELARGMSEKSAAQQRQAFEEVWGKLGPVGELLSPLEAPESASPEEKQAVADYNAAVTTVRSSAERNAFGRLDERGAALLASKAAALDFMMTHGIPRAEQQYRAVLENNRALAAELASLKKARSPGVAAGDLGAGDGAPAPKTLHEAVQRTYHKR